MGSEAVCNGSFEVVALDAKACLATFKLKPKASHFKYKVHPNLSKAAFQEEDLLCVRDPSKHVRLGHPTPLLKWQLKSNDISLLPFSLSYSATSSTQGSRAILEMELKNKSI